MKKIIITEDQLNYLRMNENIQKINSKKFTEDLMNEFRCEGKHSGGDFKSVLYDKLKSLGFNDIDIKFFKRDEYHNLYYFIHTAKVVFVVKVESDIDVKDKPCIKIVDVDYFINYKK